MVIEGTKDGYRSQISSGFGLQNPRIQSPAGDIDTEMGDE